MSSIIVLLRHSNSAFRERWAKLTIAIPILGYHAAGRLVPQFYLFRGLLQNLPQTIDEFRLGKRYATLPV